MKVILIPEARKEFFEAVEFYANESPSAAEHFIDEFENARREIGLHPDRYRQVKGKYRVIHLDRFPYSLYYRALGNIVRINAVAHDKRKPGYWRKRI
ncbi:MAG TPA: type II toxin-antitoxin system RelE/ParE family toxin [Candidatus Kapabacteria bacterium]|nr:type II toxin-antitoxin system RelE/ParE family toxin [Candidatus Kapabacteria bacterium]